MVAWAAGRPLLGFTSHPCPWAYVSGDRLLVEAQDTIETMRLSLSDIPIIPAFGQDNKRWQAVIEEAAKMKVGLLVWEGFGDLAPHPACRPQVREFLSQISACCQPTDEFPKGLTILGVMESPKLKPAERYRDPRQRISGVASWGYHTSTVMLIESPDPSDIANPERLLYASIKNAPSFSTVGRFDGHGHLHFEPPDSFEL